MKIKDGKALRLFSNFFHESSGSFLQLISFKPFIARQIGICVVNWLVALTVG